LQIWPRPGAGAFFVLGFILGVFFGAIEGSKTFESVLVLEGLLVSFRREADMPRLRAGGSPVATDPPRTCADRFCRGSQPQPSKKISARYADAA
jgi:hypothetical protein